MTQPDRELTKDQYITTVETNSKLLTEAARKGLRAPVPSCPGWYVATLVAHIGEVQRFWALQIRERAQEQQPLPREAFETCPGLYEWFDGVDRGQPDLDAIPAGLIEWAEQGREELVAAFRGIDPEEQVWHWSGDNRAITHMRNQAFEAIVHRWDAQNAHDIITPIDPVMAVDGIEQHFQVQIPAARGWAENPLQGQGETYHFHRTDGEGEWLVRFDGDTASMRREHSKGDVAVRGSAEELFLWLWGRIPAERLEVFGDAALLTRYRELVPSS